MIQPLKTSKTTWFVFWIDVEEPVPTGPDFFLPTILIVCGENGIPLAAPEILEELDQFRIEGFLLKLFEDQGAPDRLTICASEEWDTDAWAAFSKDHTVEIHFQPFDRTDANEIHTFAQAVVLRFARSQAALPKPNVVASGLVNTALRIRSPHKKIALLKSALDRDADCASARIELADTEFQNGDWKKCLSAYTGIIATEEARWRTKNPEWWSNHDTRPLLRAMYGRGMTLWHQTNHPAAAEQFQTLLDLNPADNQGARFFIPLLHLLAEQTEEAVSAFAHYKKSYPDDYIEPAFYFGWGFCEALKDRESSARKKYKIAILKNIHIAPMLLEEPEPNRTAWYPNDRAEPTYASEFTDSYAVLWDREPGSLRLLREVWNSLQPRVRDIVNHRREMADFQDQRYEPNFKALWQERLTEESRLTELKPRA